MNVLVTGSNGQLGNEMRRQSLSYPSHRFVFTDVSSPEGVETVFLDITNKEAVDVVCKSEKIDVIVNCAGYTDVGKAENDFEFAKLLNADAVGILAEVAASVSGRTLIHVSTDYVFSGDNCTPYRETDTPCPQGVYARTKYDGEKRVTSSKANYIILRTAWLYSPYGKNFVKTIMSRLAGGQPLSVVFDQVGTPTYAADLAGLILKIIDSNQLDKKGTYHFTDEGVASWYDFACAIRDISGLRGEISPCLTDAFPTNVKRPSFSVLDKTKVKETFGAVIPHWTDSLRDCIERLKNNQL